MGQRVSLWEVSGASLPRLPGGSGSETIGCGSNLLRRLPLSGSLERKMRPPTPVPLAGPGRRVGSLRHRLLGDGALLLLLSPRGEPVAGVSTVQRNLEDRSTSVLWCGFLAVPAPRDGELVLRWLSGSQGVLSFPCCARRSLTVRLPRSAQETGRLQGLAPPTSPVESESVLQLLDSLFLPWVCFPSEALSRNRVATCVDTVGPTVSRVPSRLRFPVCPFLSQEIALLGRGRTLARFRLFDSGGRFPRGSRPPWGSQRQRATVTTWRFVASSRRVRLSPLSRFRTVSQIGRAHV